MDPTDGDSDGPEMGDVCPIDNWDDPASESIPSSEALPIEGCDVVWKFKCPLKWGELQHTTDPSVRYCSVCEKSVHLCRTPEELRAHAEMRHCVAISGL
jgi:hypothetical protein